MKTFETLLQISTRAYSSEDKTSRTFDNAHPGRLVGLCCELMKMCVSYPNSTATKEHKERINSSRLVDCSTR
ncbi:hypothetical protein E2C01_014427 [Portunus trituberculatus]|uniref:Uncharacterized protein n=1 Tax=Portunus trituberculatus TaxID=210409 RepID=A0A5B7DIT1_PORTR|nr:hypothetical protein [Portunus trituberculatus]